MLLEFILQILPIIFKYLSVNDRKAVKLVCKSWFEICNLPSLMSDEVINCSRSHLEPDIFEYLDRSQHKVLNFKLDRSHICTEEDSMFWKNNGPRIRSIIFKNCHLHRNVLEKILILCPNLDHLSIITRIFYLHSKK